jgi:hypothetical protein
VETRPVEQVALDEGLSACTAVDWIMNVAVRLAAKMGSRKLQGDRDKERKQMSKGPGAKKGGRRPVKMSAHPSAAPWRMLKVWQAQTTMAPIMLCQEGSKGEEIDSNDSHYCLTYAKFGRRA